MTELVWSGEKKTKRGNCEEDDNKLCDYRGQNKEQLA